MFVVNTVRSLRKILLLQSVVYEGCVNVSVHWIVIADFDHLKKQQENRSAKPIKQLRQLSLFQVFCTFVVQRHFNPTTLLSRCQVSLAFKRYLFWP